MQERSHEKESDKQERQKLSVMHGEGVIEDMGCLISNKCLPLLCSIEKKNKAFIYPQIFTKSL